MGTSCPISVSTKQQRIAKLAREAPNMAFTTLAHHMDLEWLQEAFRRTRKDAAVGVDDQTGREYAEHLEDNLRSLLARAKSGDHYKAPPVRRVYIPKGDGKEMRGLGVPTFEDKVLQRAVVMLLEPIYEQDFMDCSYGFRPRRSQHQALEKVWAELTRMKGGWVLEVDIRRYFDAIDHSHLREILSHRVRDGVVKRLIGKWLKAGVMEDGCVTHPETGSPQGGVVSPLISNVYLHEVLDTWFHEIVMPRLKGRAFMVRFADDALIGFEREEDARRVMDVLPKRFEKYGLTLHPEKTRLIDFRKPAKQSDDSDDDAGPGTFDLLGFTHHWATSRKGYPVVKRRTVKTRFNRALKRIAEWARANRHKPIKEQQETLTQKLKGHFGYYGITGNSAALGRFRWRVVRIWKKWLSRRSQKARIAMNWEVMDRLLERFPLPEAIAVHSTLRAGAAHP
jgi:group II intron reverse transcriptase/maturase